MHFCFIKNNTYLSELRQTLSMNHLDEIVDNSLSIYNLYAYNIGVNNPLEVTYNDHTMYSGHDLTYEETKEKEIKKVKQVFRNKTNEWLHLKVVNEETQKEENITCTKNHRIYIKNKGWIEAKDILENDIVLMYNNI